MALIVYPAAGFNSYVSQTEADSIAEDYLNSSQWNDLSTSEKDQYLMTAFRTIQLLPGFEGPIDPDPVDCLATAQVEIVLHDLKYQISTTTTPQQQVASHSAGNVSQSYFENKSVQPIDSVPDTAYACLESFGVTQAENSSIGSVRKTR